MMPLKVTEHEAKKIMFIFMTIFFLLLGMYFTSAELITSGVSVDQTFTKLIKNDPTNKRAVFEIDPVEEISKDNIGVDFDVRCGQVISYDLLEYEERILTKTVYDTKQVCENINNYDNKTDKIETIEVCHTEQYNPHQVEYSKTDWYPIDTINTKSQIKLDNVNIKYGKCDNGAWGYVIDWKPYIINSDNDKLRADKWAWLNETWNARKRINITNPFDTISEQPIYLNISKETEMENDFGDIRFVDSADNEIPYEIENYSSSNAYVWILSNISQGSDYIYMYYMNEGISGNERPDLVWKNYLRVFHFSDSMLTGDVNDIVFDSSGNENATSYNMEQHNQVRCQIANCYEFEGGDQRINLGDLDLPDDFTISCLFNRNSTGNTEIISEKRNTNRNWANYLSGDKLYWRIYDGSNLVGTNSSQTSSDVWYDFVGVRDTTQDNIRIYLDSQEQATAEDITTSSITNNHNATIARRDDFGSENYFIGKIDEFRVSDTVISNHSLMLSYQNIVNYSHIIQIGDSEFNNLPPTITQIDLYPDSATTADDLLCNVTATDETNTTFIIEYFIYNGSNLYDSGNYSGYTNNTNTLIYTIDSLNTTYPETWNCTIRAYDGEDYSSYSNDEVSLTNIPPTVTSVEFDPTSADTNTSFDSYGEVSDSENTSLIIEYFIYNGSNLYDSGNESVTYDTNTLLYSVNYVNTSVGETWNCTIRAYDGEDYSSYSSTTLTVTAVSTPINDGALTCEYNPNPEFYIFDRIQWLCKLNKSIASADYKCYSYIHYEDQVIQANPNQELIEQVGLIDYYQPQPSDSKLTYFKPYFTSKNLRHDQALNFSVVCSGANETVEFERVVTPIWKKPKVAFDFTQYVKQNSGLIVGGIFIIIVILVAGSVILSIIR